MLLVFKMCCWPYVCLRGCHGAPDLYNSPKLGASCLLPSCFTHAPLRSSFPPTTQFIPSHYALPLRRELPSP